MSKALDIRKEIVTRIASLGEVIRGKRQFNEDELPALCVYTPERTNDGEQGTRFKVAAQVTIEYHKALVIDSDPDDQADAMIEEIRTAVEIEPRQLTGDLILHPGLSWLGDSIEYPPDAGDVVSVQVAYNTPHIDSFG